jgi:hypothetical protein
MASTRNINTKSDFCLQERENKSLNNYYFYNNSQYGDSYNPSIPCFGITPSHMPRDTLSYNPVEIESKLFGINSTNLVDNKKIIQPQLKQIKYSNFIHKTPLLLPKPLIVEKYQRPNLF